MKKLLLTAVAATMLATPTLAAYTQGVGITSDNECNWVNTNATQNAYWIDRTGIADFSNVYESLTYHGARTHIQANAYQYCWLNWFYQLEGDTVSSNVSSELGFDPGAGMSWDSDFHRVAFYITMDISNFVTIPQSFIDVIPGGEVADFNRGWIIASNVMNGYRGAPDLVQRGTNMIDYLEAWKRDWTDIIEHIPATIVVTEAVEAEYIEPLNGGHNYVLEGEATESRINTALNTMEGLSSVLNFNKLNIKDPQGRTLATSDKSSGSWVRNYSTLPVAEVTGLNPSRASAAVNHAAEISEYFY